MATHSSILVWRIPWTEEPGGLYSPWGRKESDMTERLHCMWSRGRSSWLSGKDAAQEMLVRSVGQEDPLVEEIGNPLHYSCLGHPTDREAWQSVVRGSLWQSRAHKELYTTEHARVGSGNHQDEDDS